MNKETENIFHQIFKNCSPKKERRQIQNELTRRGVLFMETNLLRLPMFKQRKKISYEGIKYEGIDKHGNPFKWNVLPSVEYGDMRGFEQDALLGIMDLASQKMLQNGGKVPEVIWFTTQQLCVVTGKIPKGANIRRMEQALACIRATTITTENVFKVKERRYTLDGELRLFDIVFIAREAREAGKKEEKLNRIGLGEAIRENLKKRYRYRLNPDYVRKAKTSLMKRLYMFLTFNFVSSKGRDLHFNYSTLCKEIPLERKTEFVRAKKQLKPTLNELKKTLFLRGYSWEKTKGYGKDEEWELTFKAGKRFHTEYAQNIDKSNF